MIIKLNYAIIKSTKEITMKVILNPDTARVEYIKEGLKRKEGYCPCKPKFPQNKCMCEEFRNQIADPNWYGLCYCGLYLKVDDNKKTPAENNNKSN